MDLTLGQRLIDLRARVVAKFDADNWEEVGLLTGQSDIIVNHDRLLRSLSWGDEDYAGNVLTVLRKIAQKSPRALDVIEGYLDRRWPGEAAETYISAKPSERKITFAPNVFEVPKGKVEADLVAVMMPFSAEFRRVFDAIGRSCQTNGLRFLRADVIWEESTIIQDIFNLLFRAQVVVVDFTGRNPNVMYETGIAHTLGKHVVPVAQSLDDVPFDARHHRVLKYLPNTQGLAELEKNLAAKLSQFKVGPVFPVNVGPDIPF